MRNPILNTDSYKASHFAQYPPGVEHITSYIEARQAPGLVETVTFFGLQAFIRDFLSRPITPADIDEADPQVVQLRARQRTARIPAAVSDQIIRRMTAGEKEN